MVQHALDRGYEVVGGVSPAECREARRISGRIKIIPGVTNDLGVIGRAVARGHRVLVVLVSWGTNHYASGTAQAVLDHASPGARLVFSCGWHIRHDDEDVCSRRFRWKVQIMGWVARRARVADLADQVEATRRVFAGDRPSTVVRASELEEGPSQGIPVWSRHVGDPILKSNLTRRIDFALFMVEALTNDELIHEAPAIVGRQKPAARANAATTLAFPAGATGAGAR